MILAKYVLTHKAQVFRHPLLPIWVASDPDLMSIALAFNLYVFLKHVPETSQSVQSSLLSTPKDYTWTQAEFLCTKIIKIKMCKYHVNY